MWSYPLPKSGMGCSVPIGFKKRRYENAPNAQSEVDFQAWSRPDTWRRMHNELDDRDELLLAWSTVAGSSWQPDHSRGSSAFPSAINVFPNTTLGNQLKQVAKLMKFNLGSGVPALTRQIGSDHAWGSHHLVMGGLVIGGDFYGVSGPNGTVFPTLQLGGPDDTDTRGRWIPTTSVDQYAATLARWFGVDEININTVFPQLRNFSTRDLRFII